MPQRAFGGPQPVGVIYNTSMRRPDSALALAALYGFEGKREARAGAVCVVGAGLNTAIYCDILSRFYHPGPLRNGNTELAVGLAAISPLPPDAPMVNAVVERKDSTGALQYARNVRRLADTSLAEAVLRNGVIFNAEAVVVLSGPATYLAKSLDLLGTAQLYKERVKRLVLADSGDAQEDVPALRRVLAEWPTPIFYCGPDAGRELRFPGDAIEKDFAWSPAHPVADAYRAFGPMPYDAPAYDLAAAHYAVHPDSGFFQLSEPGALSVSSAGIIQFSPGSGKVRRLSVDASKKTEAIASFVEIASAKLAGPPQRNRRPDANAQDAAKDTKAPAAQPTVIKKQDR